MEEGVGEPDVRHRPTVIGRRLTALLWLALGLSYAGVAEAQARFVVNESMEGVALGMADEGVRERLGEPERREAGPDFATWLYRRPPIEVTLKPDVITLHTTSADVRGPGSIGVRTRESRLRAVLGERVRCETTARQRLCVVGSFATGRDSTVFEMKRRRVTSVTISRSVE